MNLPILSEKRSKPDFRYRNYHSILKPVGKVSAMFKCSTSKCYASISLEVNKATQEIQKPLEVKNLNDSHIDSCLAKEDKYFKTREFIATVRQQLEMTSNQQRLVQQLYEEAQSTQGNCISLPPQKKFGSVKVTFILRVKVTAP